MDEASVENPQNDYEHSLDDSQTSAPSSDNSSKHASNKENSPSQRPFDPAINFFAEQRDLLDAQIKIWEEVEMPLRRERANNNQDSWIKKLAKRAIGYDPVGVGNDQIRESRELSSDLSAVLLELTQGNPTSAIHYLSFRINSNISLFASAQNVFEGRDLDQKRGEILDRVLPFIKILNSLNHDRAVQLGKKLIEASKKGGFDIADELPFEIPKGQNIVVKAYKKTFNVDPPTDSNEPKDS